MFVMEYRLVLLTLAPLLCTQKHCVAEEIELCYIKKSSQDTLLCIPPKIANMCCRELKDITVTVYRKHNCTGANVCNNDKDNCCTTTSQTDVEEDYRRALEDAFINIMCFLQKRRDTLSMLPNNSGLDLVKVSYNCSETTTTSFTTVPTRTEMANTASRLPTTLSTRAETTTTSSTTVPTRTDKKTTTLPTALSTRADTTTTSPTTFPTRTDDGAAAPIVVREDGGTAAPGVEEEGSSSKVAAAVAVPVALVVVGAVVVGTIFYVRRRRSRKDATEQRQEIHTNNAYIGLVSRSMGLYPTAHPTIKAEDQDTNHYYTEIADNSDHFNHSSTEDNEYQPIKPNERTANNGPPTNSFTTDKDPTGEDEYDHLGTQDTPSSRANNYEHITHISKDDCHSYDKTEFNQGNTISLDDEDNYNHAQQSAATERTETDDRDGGYSHVGGTVGGPEADDQYSTMESVMDTQDGSRHLNNYFVLEKQY